VSKDEALNRARTHLREAVHFLPDNAKAGTDLVVPNIIEALTALADAIDEEEASEYPAAGQKFAFGYDVNTLVRGFVGTVLCLRREDKGDPLVWATRQRDSGSTQFWRTEVEALRCLGLNDSDIERMMPA
jgi:hypothetical protein